MATGERRRQVILRLDAPTRDGEAEIHVLTNLPARDDAVRDAEVSRKRWRLEGHGDFVRNDLHGEIETDELAANYRAVQALIGQATWDRLAELAGRQLWAWCREAAGAIRPQAFLKHPRGPKRPQPKPASAKTGSHCSTSRLLNEAKV